MPDLAHDVFAYRLAVDDAAHLLHRSADKRLNHLVVRVARRIRDLGRHRLGGGCLARGRVDDDQFERSGDVP